MTDRGSKYDYDVAVIGSGPAGYVAAIRAAQRGARTVLIEKGAMGGVCTNAGCIPTKALAHAARLHMMMREASGFGVVAGEVTLDFSRTAAFRDGVVARLSQGVEALLKANKVDIVQAEASLADRHTLNIHDGTLSASKIIVATGSRPMALPGLEFDGQRVIDSTAAVRLQQLPGSMLIVGGGYIGCEFASAFSALGVEVTLVEMLDNILPQMDADCRQEVVRRLKKMGVTIHTGVKLEGIRTDKKGVAAELSNDVQRTVDTVLVAAGRRPCVEGIGLESAGVTLTEHGAVAVNEHMQTAQDHIYAIGDVTGGMMLAHCGSHEAVVAAEHATGRLSAVMDDRVIPSCVFTRPEVGAVGLTEQQAAEQGLDVVVKKYPLRFLGKAQVDGATDGLVKMIADADTGQLRGVHIVAEDASSLLGEAALALKLEATAAELADTVHAHPTMPESLLEAAQALAGRPINWMG